MGICVQSFIYKKKLRISTEVLLTETFLICTNKKACFVF
jgi:hypothetical protein